MGDQFPIRFLKCLDEAAVCFAELDFFAPLVIETVAVLGERNCCSCGSTNLKRACSTDSTVSTLAMMLSFSLPLAWR